MTEIREDWSQYILLVSDQHHDSPFCDRKLEKEHLDEALDKGAFIFMGGDTCDAMQGHKDPRASYDNLDPALKVDKYFDAVVDFNAKFYAPYARHDEKIDQLEKKVTTWSLTNTLAAVGAFITALFMKGS